MENHALLTDIKMRLVDARALSIYRARGTETREVRNGRSIKTLDLDVIDGHQNLAQAMVLRLLTPKGELSALAHPDYGSRLPELIGTQRSETTRNLAKLFIIDALKQESRIKKILQVSVTDQPGDRHRINIYIQVEPIDDSGTIDVGPFSLELT